LAEITGQELLTVLDEELLILPERLRAPLVLCYLQGATRDEAAQRLGCPLATLKKRLERGRARLHAALVRRGLGLSTVLLGTLLSEQSANAAATIGLARKTAQAALALTAGKLGDGMISSQVRQLVEGGLRMMRWNKLKAALALLLVTGLLATAGAFASTLREDKQAGKPTQQASVPQGQKKEPPAAAPSPTPGINLRYQFKKGDQFRYVVEKKTETQSNTLGIERGLVETQTTQTYDVTWRVLRVDSGGNARMTLTIDRLRHVIDNGLPGKFEFDSRKHRNPVGMPVVVRTLSPVLKAQVGASFTCTVSPRGEIHDFKVPKKILGAVINTPGMQALYSTESFRQLLACQGSVVLPKDSVVKGSSWDEKTAASIAGGHAKMTLYTKATYQGEADRGGKKLAELDLKPTAVTVERSPTSGLGPFTLKKHEGKGSVVFDNDKGRLVETQGSQTVDMESGAAGQTIVWKIKLSLSAKLVPAK
jgi:hypothetical protein